MPPPDLVLFDMDDVLCSYDKPARIAYLARLAGTTPEAVQAAIWDSGFEDQADAGKIDDDAYLKSYGERIGYPLTLDEWLTARRIATIPHPEVLDLARQVRSKARIAILTNNPSLLTINAAGFFPELLPLFGDAIIASASLHVAKPDPECFRRCCAMLGIAPASALFIDDRPEHVAGAEAAGLTGHRYISPPALAGFLQGSCVL